MTPFDRAWVLLKAPFISPADLPNYAHQGALAAANPQDFDNDWWVDDPNDPTAYGFHHVTDEGIRIPAFEVREDMRGKGYGEEALRQFIEEALRDPYAGKEGRAEIAGVIPPSASFWDKMLQQGIIDFWDAEDWSDERWGDED